MSTKDDLADDWGLLFALSLVPSLSEAPEDSRRALLQIAEQHYLPPGTQLDTGVKTVNTVYLVLQGHVGSYTKDANEHGQLVDIIGTNSFIGLPELFLMRDIEHVYRTIGESHILSFPSENLANTLKTNWVLLQSMLGGLSRKIHGLIGQIDSLKAQNAEQRLAAHFLECMKNNNNALAFTLPYEKKDLAAHLGIVPESLSRALKKLKASGVNVKGRKITIEDPQKLAEALDTSQGTL
ncbi:MAG: helix-turn-helix domain-containing protein [Magnetovibrio sp.]|nr:helix-turn-helix domain-containing protein [Magnetovibrio sp.]